MIADLESAASRRTYQADWARYSDWLRSESIAVLEAKAQDVKRYVKHLLDSGKKKSTRAHALSVVREVYRALVSDGLLAANPAREVKNAKLDNEKRVPWLMEEKLNVLFSLPPADGDEWYAQRNRLCVLLLIGIGWRRSEIACMTVESFSGGTVSGIVKGGKWGRALVPTWLQDEIAAWCRFAGLTNGPLFPRSPENREAISGSIVYHIVKEAGARAGFAPGEVTPHALRRTMLTLAKLKGVPIEDLQQSVCHSSQSTTEGYLKASRLPTVAPSEWMSEMVKK